MRLEKPRMLPVRVYRLAGEQGAMPARRAHAKLLAKFRVYLKDKPGSLASFATHIASAGGNISFFHYDRSLDSSRVAVEVQLSGKDCLAALLDTLAAKKYVFDKAREMKDEVRITAPENVLEIKVRLVNEPGTLASFARLLAKHGANVMYMLYDEDIDLESADVALSTGNPEEIDRLLFAVNGAGYHYKVIYRGSDEEKVERIIGLKAVEKFFLRLKALLPGSDLDEVKALVDSSQDMYADLVDFYAEAGDNLESVDVFEKVLALASMSRSSIGKRFEAVEMPELVLPGGVTLYGFRMPTSENVYVLSHIGELTMIDAGYGVYYEDVKGLIRAKGLDPAYVKRIFVTHADADHAGSAGHFQREFGSKVFMHPGSREVIANENRAFGVSGRLDNLNRYYTRLINRFTDCAFPEKTNHFATKVKGRVGPFPIIDSFDVDGLRFDVLESLGGHIPGHVFFVERNLGLMFSSDYLINPGTLTAKDKKSLGVYRYLLTTPNSDSQVYKDETAALSGVIIELDRKLRPSGGRALIFPGHGGYYGAEELVKPGR